MILELHVADVVDDHKIKMDAMRLKIRNIRKYAIHTVIIARRGRARALSESVCVRSAGGARGPLYCTRRVSTVNVRT